MSKGYESYMLGETPVLAALSPGGRFYDIILPNGEHFQGLAEVFEALARKVSNGNQPKD